MPQVFVAAGSNVAPEEHMALATRELKRVFPDARFSPWYRNRAVGFEGADFINLVAGFTTMLTVEELLSELRAIEALGGRGRDAPRWAPRSMDLDVLLYGELVCQQPGLTLPRPDLLVRATILRRLLSIRRRASRSPNTGGALISTRMRSSA
jgi:2-amino-4-hydroxy-6-hydroxymethyldihydropteridine diphosphokinase